MSSMLARVSPATAEAAVVVAAAAAVVLAVVGEGGSVCGGED